MANTPEDTHFSYCSQPKELKLGCFNLYLVRGEKYCVIGKVLKTARVEEKARWLAHKSKDGAFLKGTYKVFWVELGRDNALGLHDLVSCEDKTYSEADIKALVTVGRKEFVLAKRFDAIVGFTRFLKGYYLYIVTDFEAVGKIGSHLTYTVKRAELLPLFEDVTASRSGTSSWNRFVSPQSPRSLAEDRYKGLFMLIDLSKYFFWSDSYNLAFTLQANIAARYSDAHEEEKDNHTWNTSLAAEFVRCMTYASPWECPWTVSLIHGSFEQQRCSILGQGMTMTLLARRSRFYAGTRYLKRGVSDAGKVANEVEIEQLLQDESVLSGKDSPSITSFVQLRGSIPTFWTQETSVAVPRPPIDSFRFDPSFNAARLHFEDLYRRYGQPVTVIDLVKQQEKHKRESLLGEEYRSALRYLNTFIDDEQSHVRYYAIDFTKLSKSTAPVLLEALDRTATLVWESTGAFAITREVTQASTAPLVKGDPLKWSVDAGDFVPYAVNETEVSQRNDSTADEADSDSGVSSVHQDSESFRCDVTLGEKRKDDTKKEKEKQHAAKRSVGSFTVLEQTGVARTNCIDCLDRTNVAQFCFGLHALGHQLVLLGIAKEAYIEADSNLVVLLIRMYEDLGDNIAMQYGGSGAHRKSNKIMPNMNSFPKSNGIITYAKRYYSNAFTDHAKQDAINLFLGLFSPSSTAEDLGMGKKTVHIWDLESDFYLHNVAFKQSPFDISTLSATVDREVKWQELSRHDHAASTTEPLARLREELRRSGRRLFERNVATGRPMEFASFDKIFQRDKLHSVEIARVDDSKRRSGSSSEVADGDEQRQTPGQTRLGLPSISNPDRVLEVQLNAASLDDGQMLQDKMNAVDKASLQRYEKYAQQAIDPFSLFNDEGGDEKKEKEQEYVAHLRDMLIHEDDAWGMKRLQAHAGNTLLLLKGPHKGLPRSLAVTSAMFRQEQSTTMGKGRTRS